MKQAIITGFWVLLTAYIGFFIFWAMLSIGCVERGYSVSDCRDNTMSRVAEVIYPIH